MTPDADAPWPPAYTVRHSARARCARLRVCPGKGLEVVLPQGTDPRRVPTLVEGHKQWILRAMDRVLGAEPKTNPRLPDALILHGGAFSRPLCCKGESLLPEALLLASPREDTQSCFTRLRAWVRNYANDYLDTTLRTLATDYGFSYAKLTIRQQRSRWGSCTTRGNISLNRCLVFLPEPLSRHVLLHELAHTRHCNHGPGFWKTLFAAEPDALALDARLRKGWRHVPNWVWE